ncbi:phosphatidylinositolglycan-like protein isoform X2 [Wolffia australiana]
MSKIVCSDGQYTYYRHHHKEDPLGIDIHEIIIDKSSCGIIIKSAFILILTFCFCNSVLFPQDSQGMLFGAIFISILVTLSSLMRKVTKECVVIIPSLGIQLETYYWSGRTRRRLISVGKILKPILNEIVTPIRCYWSLALILDGHEDLTLVFQELQPPVKILAPIWKALCDAAKYEENDVVNREELLSSGH